MRRLPALLLALCAVGFALASPFLLATIRAAQPPIAPGILLALQAFQTLLLCAIAAYVGDRFAPRAGLDAPWLRAIAERRDRPPGFGGMAIEAAAIGSPLTAGVVAYALSGNALAGVVFGWMFRRRGLEGAMVAHAAADVWLRAALPALLA